MSTLRIGRSLTLSGDMDGAHVEQVLLAQLQGDRRLFGEIAVAAGFASSAARDRALRRALVYVPDLRPVRATA